MKNKMKMKRKKKQHSTNYTYYVYKIASKQERYKGIGHSVSLYYANRITHEKTTTTKIITKTRCHRVHSGIEALQHTYGYDVDVDMAVSLWCAHSECVLSICVYIYKL